MSIATMSIKTHAMTTEDELIGSLTRERVSLLVRYTGAHKFLEVGQTPAQLWLAHMLDTEVPYGAFDQLCHAATSVGMIEEADLEWWFDSPNTDANREAIMRGAEQALDNCVEHLTTLLCTQLGVSERQGDKQPIRGWIGHCPEHKVTIAETHARWTSGPTYTTTTTTARHRRPTNELYTSLRRRSNRVPRHPQGIEPVPPAGTGAAHQLHQGAGRVTGRAGHVPHLSAFGLIRTKAPVLWP